VAEAMTRDVRVARPDQSIQDAARLMSEVDAGVLPVGEGDRLVGMITGPGHRRAGGGRRQELRPKCAKS
jgi:CBS domain-containing protein